MAFSQNQPNLASRTGHHYQRLDISGHATVHNGDVNNITYEDLQNLLPRADGAQVNSSIKEHEPSCLSGTRLDILQEIKAWAEDGSDERCVFWLSGMAGTGKSTVARTVAREHLAQSRVGASFFFSKGGGDVGKARKFFTTIAFQLTQTSAALKGGIVGAMNKRRDMGTLREQWELLILEPLAETKLELAQLPLLFVIDALDECDGERDVRLILQLLATASTLKPIKLRVLVTSRPDAPIRDGFLENSGIWHRDLVLNKVSREIVDRDITIYFSEELKDIISQQDTHTITQLVQKACGLFIWAATACRYINNGKRFASKRLGLVLQGGETASTPEKELDLIYTRILSHSISGDYTEDEKDDLFSNFRRVVGAIVILFNPMSSNALASLLNMSTYDVEVVLLDLHSVLEVPASSADPIRLLHPSFRDFLLAEERCQEPQLQVNEKHAHRTLANDCIRLMETLFRPGMCGLHAPGSLLSDVAESQVKTYLPPELQYACLYWVQHLEKSEFLLHDNGHVHQFLQRHLLHWLEALAWLRRTSEAILALISLVDYVQAEKCHVLKEFVLDARRFAMYSKGIIEHAPLQLYCSALVFAPEKSIIRRTFDQSIPLWIQTKPRVQPHWNAALQTLEGHSDDVFSVAFSPDGKSIVSGSSDKTTRLWDAATGAALQTLEGHSGGVYSVAFSPGSESVVSGSSDKTVRLWDAATGAALQTLEGHSSVVYSVAFSPDGKSVVSGSSDKTMRLWDAATGAALQTLEGHSGSVHSVAFSPDGKSVVSGSSDKTVRLWDAATGAALQTLEGHSDSVHSVAFSPGSESVVSGSSDKMVRLWDAATGAALQTLEGHSDWVHSVAFSPGSESVVSGSSDKTVRLWDAATGAALQTLEGHSDWVYSVAFSPAGKSVASGSSDKTVRLWDAATGAALQTLEGHSDDVYSVALSPAGKSVASGSSDKTVRLWDAATGAALQTLEGHSGGVYSVAFSPDGKSVVSGSLDKTVRLWDAATGAALQTLEGHSGVVYSVAFSPDGKSVVSVSLDQTTRLWDAATGAALQTIHSIAFFSDGKLLDNLLLSGNWIMEGAEKIIWLPPDHRGRLIGASRRIAVLAQHSGRIIIMGFKEGSKVIEKEQCVHS